MYSSRIPRQIFNFQKELVNSNFNTLLILHSQTEKMVTNLWNKTQGPHLPMELFQYTMSDYKRISKNIKKMLDENFTKMETLIIS